MAEGTDNVEDHLSCDILCMAKVIWRFTIAAMVLIVFFLLFFHRDYIYKIYRHIHRHCL